LHLFFNYIKTGTVEFFYVCDGGMMAETVGGATYLQTEAVICWCSERLLCINSAVNVDIIELCECD